MKTKLVVVGIDGASFNFMDRWIKKGHLKNISAIIGEGFRRVCISSIPPVTFPAWKCYSTGRNPGKFGVFWWANADFINGINFNDSFSFNTYEVWDYLSKKYKCMVINVPGTYPPKKINGVMISGTPATISDSFVYPASYKKELIKRYNYRISPARDYDQDPDAFLREARELVEIRFRVLRDNIGKFDFIHLTIFYSDQILHNLWREITNDSVGENRILEYFELIDKEIGKLIENKSVENIIVMSDHGFTGLSGFFYINQWLNNEGYLKIKKDKSVFDFLPDRNKIYNSIRYLRLKWFFYRFVPRSIAIRIYNRIPNKNKEFEVFGKDSAIDLKNSRVIATAEGPVYLNPKEKDREKLINELINKLLSLKFRGSGECLIKNVYRREQIYSGNYLAKAPDIVIVQEGKYEIKGSLRSDDTIFSPIKDYGWAANHSPKGILIGAGSELKQANHLPDCSIYDIAPTILSIFGIVAPKDFDGKVLVDVLKRNKRSEKRKGYDVETEMLNKAISSLDL